MMYLFILGREQMLSRTEVEHVLSAQSISFKVLKQINDHLLVEADAFAENIIMNRLGGTIKLARFASEIKDPVKSITDFLQEAQPEGKVRFSLTGVSDAIAIQVKKKLKSQGRSVRYIMPKNTATIIHNNLDTKKGDLTVFENNLFVTCAVQDIEEFGKRDYGRPAIDSISGMLPPKLCRIMINLLEPKKNATILDPFCGSGTVLMEALLLGYNHLIGTDISQKAIEDTSKNINWTKEQYPETKNSRHELKAKAIENLSSVLSKESVDHIVFEPYMGPPRKGNESQATLEKNAEEIKKMFDAAFAAFHNILRSDGSIVCIVPRFLLKNSSVIINIKPVFKKHGFSVVPLQDKDYLLYQRSGQHVAREIWKLKKATI